LYSAFNHQDYANHHRKMSADFENLKIRLKLSHRLKRHSFESGLLSEALTAILYACQSEEDKRDIAKLRDKLLATNPIEKAEAAAS
jgi:hypothetical protein